MKRKKFKASLNDSETPYWEVWGDDGKLYANFLGRYCVTYAKDHVKVLNALPKEAQP